MAYNDLRFILIPGIRQGPVTHPTAGGRVDHGKWAQLGLENEGRLARIAGSGEWLRFLLRAISLS